jgi:hypothetical protein
MALVASLTSSAARPHPARAAGVAPRPAAAGPDRPVVRGSTTTTAPGDGSPVGGPPVPTAADPTTTATPTATLASTGAARTDTTSGSAVTTTTLGGGAGQQATTTTSVPPDPGGAVDATDVSAPSTTDPGYLDYPDDVSATYSLDAAGPVVATATWTGAADLTLSISCPGRQDQQTGPSGLSVSVGAATATAGSDSCAVTIDEPAGTQATAAYSLAIDDTRT